MTWPFHTFKRKQKQYHQEFSSPWTIIRTAQGKQSSRWRRENRQASTTIPLITLVAEGTPSLLPIFSLQTLPAPHGSKKIQLCLCFWDTSVNKHSVKNFGIEWKPAMLMLTQVTSLRTVNQCWPKKIRGFPKLMKCHSEFQTLLSSNTLHFMYWRKSSYSVFSQI